MSGNGDEGIYIYSSDTGEIRNVTATFRKQVSFSGPSWSPDGKQIAYYWGSAGVYDTYIRITNVDGSGDQELTNGYDPAWSPDGKEIVFIREGDIYKIDLASRKVSPLLVTKDTTEGSPTWSPDGEWIAYLSSRNQPNNSADLYQMKPDGTMAQQIDIAVIPGWSQISWSPDGKKIAFRSHEGCGDINVVEIVNKTTQYLMHTQGGEKDPSWSPDGKWIAFTATRETNLCIQGDGEPLILGWNIYIKKNNVGPAQSLINSYPSAQMTSPVWSPVVSLEIGKNYVISILGDQLRLRESPSLEAEVIKQFNVGEIITTTEGPRGDGVHRWWEVKEEDTGLVGWIVEEPGWFRLAP